MQSLRFNDHIFFNMKNVFHNSGISLAYQLPSMVPQGQVTTTIHHVAHPPFISATYEKLIFILVRDFCLLIFIAIADSLTINTAADHLEK